MKGVIKVEVEINYNDMLSEENLKAIYGFTGKKTIEELSKLHMSILGEKVTSLFEGLPYVKYSVDGSFESTTDEQISSIKEFNDAMRNAEGEKDNPPPVVSPIPQKIKEGNFVFEEGEKKTYDDYIRKLEDSVEHVSINLGVPSMIKVGDLVHEALREELGVLGDLDTENGVYKRYKGFLIVTEGMEDLLVIEYKDYVDNSIKQYTVQSL